MRQLKYTIVLKEKNIITFTYAIVFANVILIFFFTKCRADLNPLSYREVPAWSTRQMTHLSQAVQIKFPYCSFRFHFKNINISFLVKPIVPWVACCFLVAGYMEIKKKATWVGTWFMAGLWAPLIRVRVSLRSTLMNHWKIDPHLTGRVKSD